MAQVYYSVDVKPRDNSSIKGELQEARIGTIGISRFESDEQRVFRYAEAARHDKAENYVFIFPVRQQMYFAQRHRSGFVPPGGMIILNSSEYYEASCPDDFENITLKVPCSLLRSRVPNIDDSCAKPNPAHPALTKAVLGLASPLLAPEIPLSSHQHDGVEFLLLDLLELLLVSGASASGTRQALPTAHQRIVDYIRSNISNHELTPGMAAGACGISLRYLHKLFAGVGSSFGRTVLEMRLEQAKKLVTSESHTHLTMQQIAFACGFNSQSHFSTAFKARFGVPPKLARPSE